MKIRIVVDRIEGDIAVVEMSDRILLDIPKALLMDAKEGDIYYIEKNEDETETKHKEQSVRLKRLFQVE